MFFFFTSFTWWMANIHQLMQFLLTFRSYFLCTTSLWLNMFLMTIRYASSLSTLTRYIPRNCGSSVLPWHFTMCWKQKAGWVFAWWAQSNVMHADLFMMFLLWSRLNETKRFKTGGKVIFEAWNMLTVQQDLQSRSFISMCLHISFSLQFAGILAHSSSQKDREKIVSSSNFLLVLLFDPGSSHLQNIARNILLPALTRKWASVKSHS